ncbi:MAG TPA: FAD-dependent oxidoreductase [Phototrophicaceae bacterium]|jgi:NADH dehydrogenase FAD-containing subunit|nr:FAD-dependent oxidoreductase [Phototrophicaceae bacterium]
MNAINSTPHTPQIVIIGAGYAGMLAANRLAGRTHATVTLVNASEYFVERVRLHQQSAGKNLHRRYIPDFLNRRVNFVQGWVVGLQPAAHQIEVQVHGQSEILNYDYLVYALGSHIDRDTVPGVRDYADTLDAAFTPTMYEKLKTARRLVIVGGGLTGIEAAAELAEAHPDLQVTLLTRGRLGEGLSQKGYNHLRRVFGRLHIELIERTPVTEIQVDHVVTDNQTIPFDLCLWAGSFAVPQLAREAGIRTNPAGKILVDPYLRSLSHPDIFAIGDASSLTHRPPLRMACATAEPLAASASDNLAALLKQQPMKEFKFGFAAQCISLGRNNGLIQRVRLDDSPVEQVLTGWAAAVFKEIICRYAFRSIQVERYLPGAYWYLKSESAAPAVVAPANVAPATAEIQAEVQHGRI